jgi:hypothetical protein
LLHHGPNFITQWPVTLGGEATDIEPLEFERIVTEDGKPVAGVVKDSRIVGRHRPFMMKHAPLSSTDGGRAAALIIQDRRQVCPSADLTNAKGVLGKGAVSNFGVRAASPGAIGTPIHSSWLDRAATPISLFNERRLPIKPNAPQTQNRPMRTARPIGRRCAPGSGHHLIAMAILRFVA